MGSGQSSLHVVADRATTEASLLDGAAAAAASVGGGGNDDGAPTAAAAAPPPPSHHYHVAETFPTGSGRMMATHLLRQDRRGGTASALPASAASAGHAAPSGVAESVCVMKAGWILVEDGREGGDGSGKGGGDLLLLERHAAELRRIRGAVRGQPHAAPFLRWWAGDVRTVRSSQRHRAVPTREVRVRPCHLLRTHVYSTLADRLASRPWLDAAEKMWITSQLLEAVEALHGAGVVHGFLTTENVGLTSQGWVVLLDLSSYKARTALPDDDPTEYLYYFHQAAPSQREQQSGTGEAAAAATVGGVGGGGGGGERRRTSSEKQCYLAPERFASSPPPVGGSGTDPPPPLTAAMDVFSLGCVLAELHLNGERFLDLGDLMEYRRGGGELTAGLQQKLAKMESSAVRAACRHMLQLDPARRLSVGQYRERLQAADQFAETFDSLTALVRRVVEAPTPDQRIALAAAAYGTVLHDCVGVTDAAGRAYFERVLGPVAAERMRGVAGEKAESSGEEFDDPDASSEEKKMPEQGDRDLFAQVEALLEDLGTLQLDAAEETRTTARCKTADCSVRQSPEEDVQEEIVERSSLCKGSLLIYLQVILSTVRHVQRPATKLVGLQLINRLTLHTSDEARLQRIVPVTVSLLQDQDLTVRASAVQVLTFALSSIESFPPSDSKLFPQYIFKRVAHLISDPSLVVRLTFARCIALLAESAHRFLDISYAVRLYEAVGSGSGGAAKEEGDVVTEVKEKDATVFGNDVTKLLDADSRSSSRVSMATEQTETSVESGRSEGAAAVIAGRTLISSTYSAELAGLHEIVSRWVVHIATDQSEHSSLPKRALLGDLSRLCSFFGLDGVMSFILPQILAFLNERKDWELRAALFDNLSAVCYVIGRASTEEYVLPCVEIGIVDSEERVISCALKCLTRLVEMGLLSRTAILGNLPPQNGKPSDGLLRKYGPLLLHPSDDIRHSAVETFSTICRASGSPDCDVYLIRLLRPLFRVQPPSRLLYTCEGMRKCLCSPWSRKRFNYEFKRLVACHNSGSSTFGAWTSVGVSVRDEKEQSGQTDVRDRVVPSAEDDVELQDPQAECVREYIRLLARHTVQSSFVDRLPAEKSLSGLLNGIEGSAKLAQSVMFPRQNSLYKKRAPPNWYNSLRQVAETNNLTVSEATSIRSVSSLGQVYGLSIMGPEEGTAERIIDASDSLQDENDGSEVVLRSSESKAMEAAFTGEWGSETALDPDIVDTCMLVTKLQALDVPPLSVKLGDPSPTMIPLSRVPPGKEPGTASGDWTPKLKSLVATSSPISGHVAPVVRLAASMDQSFFVSGSHDGTCRVWELPKVRESVGLLNSSVTYSHHSERSSTKVNDVAMLEGSHSIVSGTSDGCVHVWRVDMVASTPKALQSEQGQSNDRSRVVGTTCIRQVDSCEGEVLAVSHFNSSSASVITYATQKGAVHSWDLRSSREPFRLLHAPELGHLTSMALGSDRHWIVAGTSRGYLTLWDIRFHQPAKLWRHSRGAPISRLATSSVTPPQNWGSAASTRGVRPFIFVACGPNECSMFDALSGSCTECFRTVEGDRRLLNAQIENPPHLTDIPVSSRTHRRMVKPAGPQEILSYVSPADSINCMVGSIGAGRNSYLITGGNDSQIRFWDFSAPSKCYVLSDRSQVHPQLSFERIDFDGQRRLMLCRQSTKFDRNTFHGLATPEDHHFDAIQDLKIVDHSMLLSCSRDCTVKIWR